MNDQLPSGTPKAQDYRSLITSVEYRKMEAYSNDFLTINHRFLKNYARRWVKDPLHQWSRQWEYPYVFNQLQSFFKGKETIRVLDAGSGITFFPYYIKSLYSSAGVHCVDNDSNLENIYQQINAHGSITAGFSCSDLKKLPLAPEQVDIIYCISVLEHTDDYATIIEEFYKALRPGGQLVITFDLSLDGTRDISLEKGTQLLKSLTDKFDVQEDIPLELNSITSAPDIFTTHTASEIDPNLLPWKLPQFVYRFNAFVRGNRFGAWPPLLTVFCLSLNKKLS